MLFQMKISQRLPAPRHVTCAQHGRAVACCCLVTILVVSKPLLIQSMEELRTTMVSYAHTSMCAMTSARRCDWLCLDACICWNMGATPLALLPAVCHVDETSYAAQRAMIRLLTEPRTRQAGIAHVLLLSFIAEADGHMCRNLHAVPCENC